LTAYDACPGSKVTKPDMLARIQACDAKLAGAPVSPPLIVLLTDPVSIHDMTPAKIMSVDDIQAALNRLGAKPPLAVDGRYGDQTHRCVQDFQRDHQCFIDGWAGAETCAAIEAALARSAEKAA